MMPTVTQQLQSMKLTMERVVLPALGADQVFAKEQAGLIWATLGWLLDVHEYELAYELAEAEDYRTVVAQLRDLGAAAADVPAPPDHAGDLAAVRDEVRALKQVAIDLVAAAGDPGRRILLDATRRQAQREAAWYRMTGFTQSPVGIAELLAGA